MLEIVEEPSKGICRGCCDFELLEQSLYRIVAKVKNQHRTGSTGPISRVTCAAARSCTSFSKKNHIGFSVRFTCSQCGWTFEG